MIKFVTYPSGNVWTSQVQTIVISADSGKQVKFTLSVLAGDDYETVFSADYYAYNNTVYVRALAESLDSFLRESGNTFGQFRLDAVSAGESASAEFVAFYSMAKIDISPTDWLNSRFFSTLTAIDVPPEAVVRIPTVYVLGPSATAQIKGSYLDGDTSVTFSVDVKVQLLFGLDALYEGCIDASPAVVAGLLNITADRLQVYTVIHGSRSFSVFLRRAVPAPSFQLLFRNQFNAFEAVLLEGLNVRKTDVERSEAVIDRVTQYYDQLVVHSNEIQTIPLDYDIALWLEQLFASYEVTDNSGNQILVTETSAEVSDDISEMNSLKVSWRYADNREILRYTKGVIRIFSSEFDIQFA